MWILAVVVCLATLAGCTDQPDAPPDGVTVSDITVEREGFEPVDVLIATAGDPTKAVPLVIMHGVNRNADDYLADWLPIIEGTNAVVIAPKFDDDDYPDGKYALGGMADSADDELNAREEWTFTLVEPLIAESLAEAEAGSMREYDMFGHSAGSQFVHRYLEFMPDAQVRRAVAANAGWYTVPDPDVPFPYGLRNAPETEVENFLQRDLVVLLGEEDTKEEHLRQSDEAQDQGETRVERGLNFYDEGLEASYELDVPLAWTLDMVPDVGHDHSDMAKAAARHFAR